MVEEWRTIEGFDEYEVSNMGRVRSKDRFVNISGNGKRPIKGQILKSHSCRRGYQYLSLCSKSKHTHFQVHRLVAQAFIPNPENKPQVNHIDGDKTNNRADNLEWCTEKENYRHSIEILKKHTKPIKCCETDKSFPSIKSAALYIKKDPSSLAKCVKSGKTYGGFHWVYI